MHKEYVIQKPAQNSNIVQAWSKQYIPFEPKGWHKAMREDLKQAIGEIVVDDSGLYAAYISESQKFCDVENVLFYNIGPAAFKHLSKNGICFERGFGVVPELSNVTSDLCHYYLYSQDSQFSLWEESDTLASWEKVLLPKLSTASKPHSFWYALKTGKIDCVPIKTPTRFFGLSIQLNVPDLEWNALSSVIKPLLDGIISAFHYQDIACENIMLERLFSLTGVEPTELVRLLREQKTAVLGGRALVSAYRQGIKWNPEDDACVAYKVVVKHSDKNMWNMSGRLFSVSPVNKS